MRLIPHPTPNARNHPVPQRIIIARPDLPFADTLSQICSQVFEHPETIICKNGHDLIYQLDKAPVDLLLLSLNFTDIDGTELLKHVSQTPHLQHLVVFIEHHYRPILNALRTIRANAIIDTHTEPLSSVENALVSVFNNDIYISNSLRDDLLNPPPDPVSEPLTAGEALVLQVIGTGCDNSEAAQILDIKESTVQTHRRNIMRKLNISTSAKLVRAAICLGYVRVSEQGILPKTSTLCQKLGII